MPLYSISRNLSLRGAGLGNELIPAAKSFLASRATGACLVRHSWGLNPRGYGKLFGRNCLDKIPEWTAAGICETRRISIDDWRRRRIGDYGGLAAAVCTERRWRSPLRCLVSSEMWGGYALIDPARDWVRQELATAAGVAARMATFEAATAGAGLRIGIHLRRGDFASTPADLRGRFNVRLPAEWYQRMIARLRRHCGRDAVFCLFGDGDDEEKADLLQDAGASWMPEGRGHDAADLLALSSCDLVVCSASSYSLMAVWLGRMPYIWMREQMVPIGPRLTFWGPEADSGNWMMAESLVHDAAAASSPCIPVALDGTWPADHIDNALAGRLNRDRRCDPVRYGAV